MWSHNVTTKGLCWLQMQKEYCLRKDEFVDDPHIGRVLDLSNVKKTNIFSYELYPK